MPAVLLAVPFAFLPPYLAGALFCSVSAASLTWFLTRDGYWRLPLLLGAPFVNAMATAQWSPLLCVAAFVPMLLPLVTLKFNLGVPLVLGYATKRGLLWCAIILLATIAIFPWWPRDWWGNLGRHQNLIPLLMAPGQLVLLALWRWRTREARVLLGLAAVPQVFYYDPVALWLIPQNFRRMMVLTLVSWIPPNLAPLFAPQWAAPIGVTFFYLPALAFVLFPLRPASPSSTVEFDRTQAQGQP
jgi:hypothetical protein